MAPRASSQMAARRCRSGITSGSCAASSARKCARSTGWSRNQPSPTSSSRAARASRTRVRAEARRSRIASHSDPVSRSSDRAAEEQLGVGLGQRRDDLRPEVVDDGGRQIGPSPVPSERASSPRSLASAAPRASNAGQPCIPSTSWRTVERGEPGPAAGQQPRRLVLGHREVVGPEAEDHLLGEPARERERRRLAAGDDHPDARGELLDQRGQHLQRGRVLEPVRVVEDEQDRLGGAGEPAEELRLDVPERDVRGPRGVSNTDGATDSTRSRAAAT